MQYIKRNDLDHLYLINFTFKNISLTKLKENVNVTGNVTPVKRLRQESSAAAGLNADAISLNQVSVEQQIVNYF